MEGHFLGITVGVGAIGLGYLLARLSRYTEETTKSLKERPKYYNFSNLARDAANDPNGTLTDVFVQGTVFKKGYGGDGLFVESAGIEGVAKLVTTTTYSKVYNPDKDKWDSHSDTITNQCLSVPFSLSDGKGATVTVEGVHDAYGFRSVLNMVNQTRIHPQQRSVGDYATNMILEEIPSGSLIQEHLLLYGTRIAAYGDVVCTNGSMTVLHPQEVGKSISSFISYREVIARIEGIVSTLLIVGGTMQIAVQIFFIRKRKQRS